MRVPIDGRGGRPGVAGRGHRWMDGPPVDRKSASVVICFLWLAAAGIDVSMLITSKAGGLKSIMLCV